MNATPIRPVRRILAPDGSVLSVADLPRSETGRWVPSRKAIVVAAVRGGLISLEEACRRYRLTTDELLIWERQIDHHGLAGLRVSRIKDYRGQKTAGDGSLTRVRGPALSRATQ